MELDGASTRPRIMVVDDEQVMRDLLREILSQSGYEVATVDGGKEALYLLSSKPFDLMIVDIVMPGVDGIEVLVGARQIVEHIPVIMMTGYPSLETAERLANLGATDYLTKPFTPALIEMAVQKALQGEGAQSEVQGIQ